MFKSEPKPEPINPEVLVDQPSVEPHRKVALAAWAGTAIALASVITDVSTELTLPSWVVSVATAIVVVGTAYQAKAKVGDV